VSIIEALLNLDRELYEQTGRRALREVVLDRETFIRLLYEARMPAGEGFLILYDRIKVRPSEPVLLASLEGKLHPRYQKLKP
jgi:hypothetical protein